MPRSCLFSLLLLLVAATANAQFLPAQGMQNDTGRLYLRHSPLGLIDPFDGNVTIGTEYRFTNTWSATMDAGVILYSNYFKEARSASGILLRPGVRVYPGKYKDYFVEMQLHYKQVDYRIRDWLDREIVNGVASYQELKTFRYRKQVMGVHIMGGYKQYLSKNRRLFVEVYLGLGIHIKDEFLYHEPNSRYDSPISFSATDNTNTRINSTENQPDERKIMPAMPAGIRLSYKLW